MEYDTVHDMTMRFGDLMCGREVAEMVMKGSTMENW